MAQQKAISVKLDNAIFEELQLELKNGVKMNRLINNAVLMYLQLLDASRTDKATFSDEYFDAATRFWKVWLSTRT